MAKRVFQIFDEMNVNDAENNTATAGLCPNFIRGQKVKGGGEITMGVPLETFMEVFELKKTPMLLVYDKKEYKRIEAEADNDEISEIALDAELDKVLNEEFKNEEFMNTGLTVRAYLKKIILNK